MIWLLAALQVAFIWIGWWVYNSYFTQPRHNHPPIFWNPVARALLIYGPSIGIVGLVIAAFFLTSHPWPFLIFTLVSWGYCGHKRKTAVPGHIMPVLTEDGVKLEAISTEELLEDIRSQKQAIFQSKNRTAQED
ncbi:MAG: hypothetical protein ACT4OY_01580 [Alphaproteobacteria bacterium]